MHGLQAQDLVREARERALTEIRTPGFKEHMAALRCERFVRDKVQRELPQAKDLKLTQDQPINIEIPNPLKGELDNFDRYLSTANLDALIARYPVRASGVFGNIADALLCKKRKDYERILVAQIAKNPELAQKIRRRVGPLAVALGLPQNEEQSEQPSDSNEPEEDGPGS